MDALEATLLYIHSKCTSPCRLLKGVKWLKKSKDSNTRPEGKEKQFMNSMKQLLEKIVQAIFDKYRYVVR